MGLFLRSMSYVELSHVCGNNSYILKMPTPRKRHTNCIVLLQLNVQLTIGYSLYQITTNSKKSPGRYNVTLIFMSNF